MEAAHMGAWQWDLASDRLSLSEGMGRLFGVAPGTGPRNSDELFKAAHPGDREALARAMAPERTPPGAPSQLEFRVVWPDGTIHWLDAHSNAIRDGAGKPVQSVGVVMDITQRKQSAIALERAHRALRTLSAGNTELVHATSESDLLHAVCRVIVEKGGYRMAAVGYPKDDPDKTIMPMAWAGAEQGNITAVGHSWADTAEGQRPIARAIRTRVPAIARNTSDDPALAPAMEPAATPGYASNLALPLLDGTHIIGALSIYSEEKEAFDEAEIQLLEELSRDLAYGIATLRTRAERDHIAHQHQHHEQILRRSLEDSIQAIASTVEMRDPYTSGHQKRVADLAVAIAMAMGLDEEKIHGIHLAGVIHDLGKITVPAEILAKPGKISAIEFQLIKGHAQAGYDILKDISFPWPIANVVREHHERLDGSGYPRGIKGGEILLESRIMAVADVVEAMASHRPYRPSLGIEPALNEIERGRGTAYDPAVVDACLKLFREDGFALQT
jgi:PAS domain S-box-containing protein